MVMPLRMLCQVVYGGLGSFQVFVCFFHKQIGELKVTERRVIVFNVVQKSLPTYLELIIDWGCDLQRESANKVFLPGCCSRFCQCFSCSYCRFSSLDYMLVPKQKTEDLSKD